MSPRRRKDRHEASGFSRRPDPDSDEDEDYERERRKRSKGSAFMVLVWKEEKKREGNSQSYFMNSVFLCPHMSTHTLSSEPLE